MRKHRCTESAQDPVDGGCGMHACNNFSGCAKKSEIYFDDQWDLNDNILYLN